MSRLRSASWESYIKNNTQNLQNGTTPNTPYISNNAINEGDYSPQPSPRYNPSYTNDCGYYIEKSEGGQICPIGVDEYEFDEDEFHRINDQVLDEINEAYFKNNPKALQNLIQNVQSTSNLAIDRRHPPEQTRETGEDSSTLSAYPNGRSSRSDRIIKGSHAQNSLKKNHPTQNCCTIF